MKQKIVIQYWAEPVDTEKGGRSGWVPVVAINGRARHTSAFWYSQGLDAGGAMRRAKTLAMESAASYAGPSWDVSIEGA